MYCKMYGLVYTTNCTLHMKATYLRVFMQSSLGGEGRGGEGGQTTSYVQLQAGMPAGEGVSHRTPDANSLAYRSTLR